MLAFGSSGSVWFGMGGGFTIGGSTGMIGGSLLGSDSPFILGPVGWGLPKHLPIFMNQIVAHYTSLSVPPHWLFSVKRFLIFSQSQTRDFMGEKNFHHEIANCASRSWAFYEYPRLRSTEITRFRQLSIETRVNIH